MLSQWRSTLLRPLSEAFSLQQQMDLQSPYTDPALGKHSKRLGRFYAQLFRCGMLRFRDGWTREKVGIFFVRKKNGRIRIIIDTRIANTYFAEPSHIDLPTAAAWCSLEADANSPMYFAACDLDNALHRMRLPNDLCDTFFSMPPCQREFLPKDVRSHAPGDDVW
eukprot:5893336-Karenia_brevis.AAC.1